MDLQQHACTKTPSIEKSTQTIGASVPLVALIVATLISPALASPPETPRRSGLARSLGRTMSRVLQTRQPASAFNADKTKIESASKRDGTPNSELSALAELPHLPDTTTQDPETSIFDSELASAIAAASRETSPPKSSDKQDSFDEEARRVFEAASNGEFPDGETGNIVLDDMLKVMRQNGPVSSRLASSRGFDELESPLNVEANAHNKVSRSQKHVSSRAKAAEQLLKAARLLEKQTNQLPSSVSLIDEMRVTARKLLTEGSWTPIDR